MSRKSSKIRVLMVGTDESTKGGMWTVASNYINSDLYNKYVSLKYIASSIVGSIPKRLLFTLCAYIKIVFHLIFTHPQILHVHMAEKGSVYRKGIIIRISKLFRCKTVIHMHGAEFQVWYESLPERKKRRVKRILNHADKVVILGKYWADFVSSIVEGSKVTVIYNAVPHHDNIYNPDGSKILFLGVVGQRKGAYDLVNAFSEVVNDIPSNIELVFYGPDFEHRIDDMISKSKAKKRIHYCGWLGKDDKEAVFEDTLCCILPSYNEGLPMTILETMAAGIPNISTSVAAIPEVLNNNNGIIIEPGKIEDIKQAIKEIASDRQARINKSKFAYSDIEKGFTIDVNVKRVLKLYKELI